MFCSEYVFIRYIISLACVGNINVRTRHCEFNYRPEINYDLKFFF